VGLHSFQYLLLMAGCLLVTLPLEWLLGARVYRRLPIAVLAILPVVVVFSIWDVVGILRNHWSYNPAYVTGLQLPFSMPIEELVFFVVIPLCGLLTYEAVGTVLRRLAARRQARSTTVSRRDA
jgi:lycopene beta-cyclase